MASTSGGDDGGQDLQDVQKGGGIAYGQWALTSLIVWSMQLLLVGSSFRIQPYFQIHETFVHPPNISISTKSVLFWNNIAAA